MERDEAPRGPVSVIFDCKTATERLVAMIERPLIETIQQIHEDGN